jgi:hypothetical protein
MKIQNIRIQFISYLNYAYLKVTVHVSLLDLKVISCNRIPWNTLMNNDYSKQTWFVILWDKVLECWSFLLYISYIYSVKVLSVLRGKYEVRITIYLLLGSLGFVRIANLVPSFILCLKMYYVFEHFMLVVVNWITN